MLKKLSILSALALFAACNSPTQGSLTIHRPLKVNATVTTNFPGDTPTTEIREQTIGIARALADSAETVGGAENHAADDGIKVGRGEGLQSLRFATSFCSN